MTSKQLDVVPQQTVAQAQAEVDRLHRSGSVSMLSLAAFWGVAAALYTWGSPLAGTIALLVGSAVAHPVAWLVLKLAGGPAMIPRSNALQGLSYQVAAIPLIGVVGAMALAESRPDAFFASAMLGLSAAALPAVALYGRKLYLALAVAFLLLPALAWFGAKPLLPWFGLLGVALLLVFGALFLRRLGGLGVGVAAAGASVSQPDAAVAASAGGDHAPSGTLTGSATELPIPPLADPTQDGSLPPAPVGTQDPYDFSLEDEDAVITDRDVTKPEA